MKENDEIRKREEISSELETLDPKMREALGNFKSSVFAWSEAMMSQPRTVQVEHTSWRHVAGWALGCVLVVGVFSGGVYDHHHRQELARVAALQEAEHQRQLAAERAKAEEDLMAKIDTDVSREVPSAMEPLASLMADDDEEQSR